MFMEFLNNLWIAVSTPNEGLINVILFFAGFVEAFILMNLFLSIFNIEATKKAKLIYIILNALFSTFTRYFIADPFNMIFNYIIMFIIIRFIFKLDSLKTIVAISSSIIIFSLLGILVLNPYLKLLNLSNIDLVVIPIYRFFYLVLLYCLATLLSKLLKKKKFKISILGHFDSKNKHIIISNFIIGLFTLFLQIVIMVYYISNLPILFTILSFISLLAYFIISVYSLTRATELVKTTQALQNSEEYNGTLRIIHDNVRCFQHDFDNIVTTIGGYIQTDDMEGLKKYYNQLEDDCQRCNNLYILNPEIINNPGIYSLLTTKYYEAEEKNIKVNLSFLLDLNKLKMKVYEFARILGILLDNSIEAASECDEKIINIAFRNDEKNNRQIVLIENTYKDVNIDINKIFDKGVSGKEKHTGLGLWEIRKILKKNTNLNLYTNKNDKYFIQQLEIYY